MHFITLALSGGFPPPKLRFREEYSLEAIAWRLILAFFERYFCYMRTFYINRGGLYTMKTQVSIRSVVARYLSSAPLDDYRSLGPARGQYSTVGWGLERVKDKIDKATSYFASRKDSWAIIVKPGELGDKQLQAYVAKNPKLKRSKIIVVSSESLSGDETAPEWVVLHDIVGHGIGANHNLSFPFVWALHEALPRPYKISSDPADLAPDVYSAIFFHADLRKLVDDATAIAYEAYTDPSSKSAQVRQRWASKNSISVLLKEYSDFPEELTPKDVRARIQSALTETMGRVAEWSSKFKPGIPIEVSIW